jgi:hypothetical protein
MTATPDVLPGGQRWWRCDACGTHGEWGDGWRWLGHYAIEGRGSYSTEREVIQRVLCPNCPNDVDAPNADG